METKLAYTATRALRSTLSSSSRPLSHTLSTLPTSSNASTSLLKPLLPPASPLQSNPLPLTTPSALHLLKSQSTPQKGLYIVARLHSRDYLLHPKDILTIPNLKTLPPPGSLLSLDRITQVGSREYAIKSPNALRLKEPHGSGTLVLNSSRPTLPSSVVRCHLTVLEHTKSPLESKLLKKRRKGYKKTIQHKQGWTRLRVGDVVLGSGVPEVGEEIVGLEGLMEELGLEGEGEVVVEQTEGAPTATIV